MSTAETENEDNLSDDSCWSAISIEEEIAIDARNEARKGLKRCDCNDYGSEEECYGLECIICKCVYKPDSRMVQCSVCPKQIPDEHIHADHHHCEICESYLTSMHGKCYKTCVSCQKVFCLDHKIILECSTEYRNDDYDICKDCFFAGKMKNSIYKVNIADIKFYIKGLQEEMQILIKEKEILAKHNEILNIMVKYSPGEAGWEEARNSFREALALSSGLN